MRNLVVEQVESEYERLRLTVEGFCGCESCREDVIVYALNRLPPRYVTQPKGAAVSDIELHGGQPKVDVARVLLDGLRLVRATPRPGHAPAG